MNARGCKELKAHQLGKKLSLKQAILAKCADCLCNYADGKIDCKIPECPLYPFMPYGVAWQGRERKLMPESTLKAMRQGQKRVSSAGIREQNRGRA